MPGMPGSFGRFAGPVSRQHRRLETAPPDARPYHLPHVSLLQSEAPIHVPIRIADAGNVLQTVLLEELDGLGVRHHVHQDRLRSGAFD